MSAKWRHYDTFMSVFLFENITFLFQFFIYDILKETACKYLTFNFFLYIKGFWRIFWRHWRNWRNRLFMPNSKSIDYLSGWELSLGYLLIPKFLFFWLVLVFFISPSFWPFCVFSDKDTFLNWRHAVISPDVKFSIHALDSPWIVVFYRVFDFFNTTCQCIFIGDWNRPIFSEKNDFWRKNWSRDHTFCLISSKRLKKTYVSLYKILFALSRRFDWYIIWWGFLKKSGDL